MKKIIALIVLILFSVAGYSQYKSVYVVANDTTKFGAALPKRTLVFDYNANVLYRVDTLGNISSTITSLGLTKLSCGTATMTSYIDPTVCQPKLKVDTIIGCNKVVIRGKLTIDTLLTRTTITDTLTDSAPTDTELTAAIGMTATVAGKGASFVVIDADGSKDVYDVISNGTEWWYVKRTKAL